MLPPRKSRRNSGDKKISETVMTRSQAVESVFMFQGKPPEPFSFVDSEWV